MKNEIDWIYECLDDINKKSNMHCSKGFMRELLFFLDNLKDSYHYFEKRDAK